MPELHSKRARATSQLRGSNTSLCVGRENKAFSAIITLSFQKNIDPIIMRTIWLSLSEPGPNPKIVQATRPSFVQITIQAYPVIVIEAVYIMLIRPASVLLTYRTAYLDVGLAIEWQNDFESGKCLEGTVVACFKISQHFLELLRKTTNHSGLSASYPRIELVSFSIRSSALNSAVGRR
jgi:hypothetical protein